MGWSASPHQTWGLDTMQPDLPDATRQSRTNDSKLKAFIRFSRPHTILGTSCQVFGIFIIVMYGQPLVPALAGSLLLTWLASLAANLYVVGLNQVYDVAIDRVNKPTLPLASGEFSLRTGWIITLLAGLLALVVAVQQGMILLLTLLGVMALGTLYSVPPLRLKLKPLLAALSIALARGVVANLGIYLHFRQDAASPASISPLLVSGMLLFFFLFGWVISLYKDIPDWAGDRQFAVRTFAVSLGRARVFQIGRILIVIMYLLPIGFGILLLPSTQAYLLIALHAAAVLAIWLASARTDPSQPASMMRLYLFLWVLFYLEYLILVLARLVN
jgi:homogentisate phytyltransferase/homogentisate geranylgeranyltransferase